MLGLSLTLIGVLSPYIFTNSFFVVLEGFKNVDTQFFLILWTTSINKCGEPDIIS